jgi:hypothetical protein
MLQSDNGGEVRRRIDKSFLLFTIYF